jgi:hypothetical protein
LVPKDTPSPRFEWRHARSGTCKKGLRRPPNPLRIPGHGSIFRCYDSTENVRAAQLTSVVSIPVFSRVLY